MQRGVHVILGINIQQQNLHPFEASKRRSEVNSGGRLADTSLLGRNSDDARPFGAERALRACRDQASESFSQKISHEWSRERRGIGFLTCTVIGVNARCCTWCKVEGQHRRMCSQLR